MFTNGKRSVFVERHPETDETAETCPRCHGEWWVCELHPDQPPGHRLENGELCWGWAMPCPEPNCPGTGRLEGWRSKLADLEPELSELTRRVLEQFGTAAYEQALIRASAVAKMNPHDPRAWNLALCDELKRLLGPH